MQFAMLNNPETAVLITATTRVEDWQRDLTPGDTFLIVARENVTIYGRAVAPAAGDEPLPPRFRHAMLFSAMRPHGDRDVVDLITLDLPMTPMQWESAKVLGWPQNIEAVRAIMTMCRPACA
jgi:hypothetical protein